LRGSCSIEHADAIAQTPGEPAQKVGSKRPIAAPRLNESGEDDEGFVLDFLAGDDAALGVPPPEPVADPAEEWPVGGKEGVANGRQACVVVASEVGEGTVNCSGNATARGHDWDEERARRGTRRKVNDAVHGSDS
jgi:hypothetical protein